jgi:hypothetical protein
MLLIQKMVSSLSLIDHPVHRYTPDGQILTVTVPDAVLIQFDLLMMSKILLENMYM